MQHNWDESTPYCTRCGIQKGWHAEECLATANVVGFMHHLAKRRLPEPLHPNGPPPSNSMGLGKWIEENHKPDEGKIIVEAFTREPA